MPPSRDWAMACAAALVWAFAVMPAAWATKAGAGRFLAVATAAAMQASACVQSQRRVQLKSFSKAFVL